AHRPIVTAMPPAARTSGCGGPGLSPAASSPFVGELDDATATKIADLGRGCLYYGGGNGGVLSPLAEAAGATTLFSLSGTDPTFAVAANAGSSPKDCSIGAGPATHCLTGDATDGMACTGDADCSGIP